MNTLITRPLRAAWVFVLALVFLAAPAAHAQETQWRTLEPTLAPSNWSFGLKAGLANTDFYGSSSNADGTGVGFTGGAYLTYHFHPRWALQSELMYTHRTGTEDHSQVFRGSRNAEYTFGFLEVPVLIKAYLPQQQGPAAYATVGPYASMRLYEDARDANNILQTVDLDSELRPWDYGVAAGFGMESFANGRSLSFDARYNWGLANLFTDETRPDFRTRGFTFAVGIGL